MKKKLKGYIFVDDSFGALNGGSLQHPIKEAEDGFWLGNKCMTDITILRIINKGIKGDLLVTADIVYKVVKTSRIITSIDIESIRVIRD